MTKKKTSSWKKSRKKKKQNKILTYASRTRQMITEGKLPCQNRPIPISLWLQWLFCNRPKENSLSAKSATSSSVVFRTTAKSFHRGRTQSDTTCLLTTASWRCPVSREIQAKATIGHSTQPARECLITAAFWDGGRDSRGRDHQTELLVPLAFSTTGTVWILQAGVLRCTLTFLSQGTWHVCRPLWPDQANRLCEKENDL